MTLEATAGWNPVATRRTCTTLAPTDPRRSGFGVEAAGCQLTSRTGAPVDQPHPAQVRGRMERGTAEDVAPAIESIVRDALQGLPYPVQAPPVGVLEHVDEEALGRGRLRGGRRLEALRRRHGHRVHVIGRGLLLLGLRD
jgi:hypothetical protein